MKKLKHIGAYGLILKNENILLIKKVGGPYDGKLDLPGGTIEFGETPEDALIREMKEETGIDIIDYELYDSNSVTLNWNYNDEIQNIHHLGIFYKILKYENEVLNQVNITKQNDDSLGAEFYKINDLNKKELSAIVILELEKLGYQIKD